MIGNSKKSESFKGIRPKNLPVHYSNKKKKGWMDQQIFKEWFEKTFFYKLENILSLKFTSEAVLLIDYALSHLRVIRRWKFVNQVFASQCYSSSPAHELELNKLLYIEEIL